MHGYRRPVEILLDKPRQKDDPYWQQDIWDIRQLGIASSRVRENERMHTMRFAPIENTTNKNLLKEYIQDLVLHGEQSWNCVYGSFASLRRFLIQLGPTDLKDMTPQVLNATLTKLGLGKLKSSTTNTYINRIQHFLIALSRSGCYAHPIIDFNSYRKPHPFSTEHIKGISPKILQQIFSNLKHMRNPYDLILLLIYHTGMRSAEAVSVTADSLFDDDGTYYIRYYQSKMRKVVVNPIPKYLYELLQKQQASVLRQHPDEKYLFPWRPGEPILVGYINKVFNNFCAERDIRDEQGNLYRLHVHAFRHEYAMRMVRQGIPFLYIQNLLHHKSPEMSLVYAQVESQKQKERYMTFFNNRGTVSSLLGDDQAVINSDILWAKHMLNQVLPNGYCAYPVKLGVCPHSNACILCGYFRTSKEFLPVLERQQVQLRLLLKRLDQEGVTQGSPRYKQQQEAKKVGKKLASLIKTLKGGSDDKRGSV